jgi:hypothetical protein
MGSVMQGRLFGHRPRRRLTAVVVVPLTEITGANREAVLRCGSRPDRTGSSGPCGRRWQRQSTPNSLSAHGISPGARVARRW